MTNTIGATPEERELIEDLLRREVVYVADPELGPLSGELINPDGPEAANLLESLISDRAKLREALTPSGDTKAAYHGEFSFSIEMYHPRLGSECRSVQVPWTTIKEIMAAISERAALNTTKGQSNDTE